MFRCFCDSCGKEIPDVKDVWLLDLVSRNGDTNATNGATLCDPCHSVILGAMLVAKDEKITLLKQAEPK